MPISSLAKVPELPKFRVAFFLVCSDPRPLPKIKNSFLEIFLIFTPSGTAILVTDHNVKNLFDITDRSYVLGEQTIIAQGTSREILKSTKAIQHYFGSDYQ